MHWPAQLDQSSRSSRSAVRLDGSKQQQQQVTVTRSRSACSTHSKAACFSRAASATSSPLRGIPSCPPRLAWRLTSLGRNRLRQRARDACGGEANAKRARQAGQRHGKGGGGRRCSYLAQLCALRACTTRRGAARMRTNSAGLPALEQSSSDGIALHERGCKCFGFDFELCISHHCEGFSVFDRCTLVFSRLK
jgi:hypothetical protein